MQGQESVENLKIAESYSVPDIVSAIVTNIANFPHVEGEPRPTVPAMQEVLGGEAVSQLLATDVGQIAFYLGNIRPPKHLKEPLGVHIITSQKFAEQYFPVQAFELLMQYDDDIRAYCAIYQVDSQYLHDLIQIGFPYHDIGKFMERDDRVSEDKPGKDEEEWESKMMPDFSHSPEIDSEDIKAQIRRASNDAIAKYPKKQVPGDVARYYPSHPLYSASVAASLGTDDPMLMRLITDHDCFFKLDKYTKLDPEELKAVFVKQYEAVQYADSPKANDAINRAIIKMTLIFKVIDDLEVVNGQEDPLFLRAFDALVKAGIFEAESDKGFKELLVDVRKQIVKDASFAQC